MPRSKKGRLSGSARKEINDRRAGDIVSDVITAYRKHAADPSKPLALGDAAEIAFARITKMTGANHVRVAIDTRHGPKELIARIPNVYARRGSTPITTRDVVTIYVGTDFDADHVDASSSAVHFDITSVLSTAQTQQLKNCGAIPEWMAMDDGAGHGGKASELGFEFDYGSGIKEEEEDGSDSDTPPSGFSRKNARIAAHHDEEVDVDAI